MNNLYIYTDYSKKNLKGEFKQICCHALNILESDEIIKKWEQNPFKLSCQPIFYYKIPISSNKVLIFGKEMVLNVCLCP